MSRINGHDDFKYGPFVVPNTFSTGSNLTFHAFYIETDGFIELVSNFTKNKTYLQVFESDVDLRRKGEIIHGEIRSLKFINLTQFYVRKACNSSEFT